MSSIEALEIIDRMRQAIEDYVFEDEIKVTVCGGVKEFENEIISDFINQADMKLYQAKNDGENCVKA